jgi:peptidoglycan-associated lipoprotein
MKKFDGYPMMVAAVAVAVSLSGCGQASRPAPTPRPPTMDVSIVVTVEYYDPDELPEAEEAPVIAEAPRGELPLAGLKTSADEETRPVAEAPVGVEPETGPKIPPAVEKPAIAEAPADWEPAADPRAMFATERPAALETRVAGTMWAAVRMPDFGENGRIFFPFDSAVIQGGQRALIQVWGDWLGENPSWALRLEGHADRLGPCLYNRWLGRRRADAARDILVNNGIDASRLLTVSFGEDRPAMPGASLAERSRNRRVRAVPMRPADLEGYDPSLPPCAPAGAGTTQTYFTPLIERNRSLFAEHRARRVFGGGAGLVVDQLPFLVLADEDVGGDQIVAGDDLEADHRGIIAEQPDPGAERDDRRL